MNAIVKGNNPERWQKLLDALDEKLQLGLLDRLKKIASYHFEEDVLYLNPASAEDEAYLSRETHFHQLELFAQETIAVDRVKIKREA